MGSASTPPVITNDQMQLARRLDDIFMPHAREKRDEAYKDKAKPQRFVHYTSAESAFKIITSKRIWLRNATCMSDYREVNHGFDLLNTFFMDHAKRAGFYRALDQCAQGSAEEAVSRFNQSLPDTRLNTFIACFSEHFDGEDRQGRLSMWRAIPGIGARVAIAIKIPAFSGAALALNVMFSPVAYMTEPQVHTELSRVVKNIEDNVEFLRSVDRNILINFAFTMLIAGVVSLKHKGFEEEKEWRAIYFPNRTPSALMESATEIVGGVPQIVYKIPLDNKISATLAELDAANIFDRLIIGPSPYPWVMYRAFAEALASIGVSDADKRVWTSDIPIR